MAEAKKRPKKPASFEQRMKRLESIVDELGDGGLPLAKALKLFEEGQELAAGCAKELDEADKKIEVLIQARGGGEDHRFEIDDEDDIDEVLEEELDGR